MPAFSGKLHQQWYINGYERSPITDVTLKNCTFDNVERGNQIEGIKNLILDNVKINGKV